uniref:DEAD/DEAH box helicase n=1 Tax=Strongyloides papillosus TaxID=174720 RepID=A0A0N5BQW9_STREA
MVFSKVLVNENNCYHEVFYNSPNRFKDIKGQPLHNLGLRYELDPFQRRAHLAVDNNESVLITAHTSAGKTVVADYVIAMCLRKKMRCFYTTPIKALSNQKYNEFKEKYGDVGLLTGDVTISPNSSVLVMTAEVLREMVFQKKESLKNETAYVIVDEGHFIGNKERGFVWEETIIKMPREVRMCILSATLPNFSQIAMWLVELKGIPLHVIGTTERPIPLEYCFHCSDTQRVVHIKMADGPVNKNALKTAMSESKKNRGKKELQNLLHDMEAKGRLPVIIYCPSRKTCDSMSQLIASSTFLDETEEKLMKEAVEIALSLGDEKLKTAMSEINDYKERLLRGIAVHHSSLMKFTKEFIEECFVSGGIKVIFSTETLAIGLNMPATSVIFTSIEKFDGERKRRYEKSEFIQMAGRAGRRGLDSQGTVVLSLTETVNEKHLLDLLSPTSEDLKCQMNISYKEILFYAKTSSLQDLQETMNLSFWNFSKRGLENIFAMCNKKLELLKNEGFLTNDNKITAKGSIALSARFNPNYLAIGELLSSNAMSLMQYSGIIEIFSMLQKSDEAGNEDTKSVDSTHRKLVETQCEKIFNYEKKYGIVRPEAVFSSPVVLNYITAMRDIYRGKPIPEVSEVKYMYKGSLIKKVRELRLLLESLSKSYGFSNYTKEAFRTIAKTLKNVEKNDISMLEL